MNMSPDFKLWASETIIKVEREALEALRRFGTKITGAEKKKAVVDFLRGKFPILPVGLIEAGVQILFDRSVQLLHALIQEPTEDTALPEGGLQ